MSKRTIEIVTHTAPPTSSSGRGGLFWGTDYAEACATFQRLCAEYPEHLIQQYTGNFDVKNSELDEFIRAAFWHNRPIGRLVTDRPGMVDGIREIVTVVRLTDAQYNVVRTLDPYGHGTLTQGEDGIVRVTQFEDDEVSESTINPDGTSDTLTRGLDGSGWNPADDEECTCGAPNDAACMCGVTLDAVESPAVL